MELREALSRISEIRDQIAQTETFRGYRSFTIGATGLLAFLAAVLQSAIVPNAQEDIRSYLFIWIAVAAISILVAGTELCIHACTSESLLARQLTALAVQQFLPCLVAGTLITVAIALRAADLAWMLPGLWSLTFSLGIFASCRLLPKMLSFVAVYYLLCGTILLFLAEPSFALSPWAMGVTFGLGQLSAALILYLSLERSHEPAQ